MKNKVNYDIQQQETLVCTVCGTEFRPDDDTKYIIAGGYTCSWKCFLKEAKERNAKRTSQKEKKK